MRRLKERARILRRLLRLRPWPLAVAWRAVGAALEVSLIGWLGAAVSVRR